MATNTHEINICAGDYNFTEQASDRMSNKKQTRRQQTFQTLRNKSPKWTQIKNELYLMDAKDHVNKKGRYYTHIHRHGKSRLDRIYLTEAKINLVTDEQILPIACSDHDMYNITLDLEQERLKPKLWKMNVSLLDDPEMVQKISDYWVKWQNRKDHYMDPLEWWEDGKKYVKKKIIHESSVIKRQKLAKEKEYHTKLKQLEKEYLTSEENSEKKEIKQQIKKLEEEKWRVSI